MLKNKQKNMKTRSCRMRDLNSSGSIWGLGSILSFPIIQSPPPPYLYGTATSQDFKNVIKDTDPSTFISTTFKGQDIRRMFDRRTDSFNYVNAYLFNAEYEKNGLTIEIQVNPEFSQDVASSYARQYANEIGKLPIALRRDVRTVWIHNGDNPFGGGNNNLLIHVKQGDNYIRDGILEEILIHEACHTSLDYYAYYDDWIKAQEKDKKYISTYARENPDREDIAESFIAYFAVTYRKDRISKDTYEKVIKTIPNRIKFFDSLNLDMYPYVKSS
jgi:hypothetical protein